MNKKGIISIGAGAAALTYGIIKLIKGNKPADDVELETAETCDEAEESDCEEEDSEE